MYRINSFKENVELRGQEMINEDDLDRHLQAPPHTHAGAYTQYHLFICSLVDGVQAECYLLVGIIEIRHGLEVVAGSQQNSYESYQNVLHTSVFGLTHH